MLRGGEHRGGTERGSLETGDGRRRQRVSDGWILPIAFISPPPAVVARHANTGCERPADARPEHLLAGDVLLLLDECRVAARAHAHVLRVDDPPSDVVVPVHSIPAKEDGDPPAAFPRAAPEDVPHRLPRPPP